MYVDIMTGGKIVVNEVANMELINWSLRSAISNGGDGIKKGLMEGIVILSRYEFHLIRKHENLSNNISITKLPQQW